MISSLRGIVLTVQTGMAVVEVGGVGLAVHVTPHQALGLRPGHETRLLTNLVVREDALTLYGFGTADELQVFELLIQVTGVGPKSALGVLAALTPEQIASAVRTEDDAVFRRVSGIGPKTAKLIVLSLAGKLPVFATANVQPPAAASGSLAESVLGALVGLGWSEKTAAQVVDEVISEAGDTITVQMALRQALARLSPAQQGSAP